jgi:hypothetical protein
VRRWNDTRNGAIYAKVTYLVTYIKIDRLLIGALTGNEKEKRTGLLTSNLSILFYAKERVVSTFHCMYNALTTSANRLLRLPLRRDYYLEKRGAIRARIGNLHDSKLVTN